MPPPKVTTKDNSTNIGNLAEGVLGAAIVAKVSMRESGGKIGKVTATEVIKVLRIMQKAPSSPKGVSKTQIKVDVGGTAKDRIIFHLNLGKVVMEELRKMKLVDLTKISTAASSYVNSPRIAELAESMYQNNTNNKLEINVDGISDNRGTKADIVVKNDNFVFDKISLKAGAQKSGHTLGQVGGNTWQSLLRVFGDGASGLGISMNVNANERTYLKLLTEKPTFQTVEKGVKFAYKEASHHFNRLGSVAATNVHKFIRYHTMKEEEDIKLVKLHNLTHKTLNPLKLEAALKGLKIKGITRLDSQWPIFMVYDGDMAPPTTIYSPSVIFSVTVKIDSRQIGYIYHLVKEGARLQELILEQNS